MVDRLQADHLFRTHQADLEPIDVNKKLLENVFYDFSVENRW